MPVALAIVNEDSLFSSVHAALASAYSWEVRAPCKISSALVELRGSTVRAASVMTPLDWVGQAGLTMRLMRQVLTPAQAMLVEARYTVPAGRAMARRKALSANCVEVLHRGAMRNLPPGFRRDAVRTWCGLRPWRTDASWAEHYGRARSTIFEWRRGAGRGRRRPGVETVLDARLGAAQAVLEAVFEAAGLIP